MHEKHCQGVLNGDSCATLFLPAFYGILTAESLTNSNRQQGHISPESLSYSKFGRGQQGYKAYSLGLFRGKMFRFFQVLYSEKDGFDKSYMPGITGFNRFYISKRQVLAGLIKGKCQVMSSYCPDRLSNVKFPCPRIC